MAASTGVQQVLDAAGMTPADLQDLEENGFQLASVICKRSSFLVSRLLRLTSMTRWDLSICVRASSEQYVALLARTF